MATSSVTHTITNGTPADASQVMDNFNDLVGFDNNSVVHRDGSKSMSGNLNLNSNGLTNGLGVVGHAGVVPVGSIVAWPTASAPTSWLLCNGAAVSRTTYATLFALIGTTFGAGDGSTTFNLPNLQQRFILGKAASGTGSTLGGTGGNIDHVHTGPSHSHTVDPPSTASSSAGGHSHTVDPPSTSTSNDGAHTHTDSFAVGGETSGDGSGPSAGAAGTGHYHVLSGSINSAGSSHQHSVNIAPVTSSSESGHTHSTQIAPFASAAGGTANTGTANPPFMALNYIIKA